MRSLKVKKGPSQDQGEGPTSQPLERFAQGLARGDTRPEEVCGDVSDSSDGADMRSISSECRGGLASKFWRQTKKRKAEVEPKVSASSADETEASPARRLRARPLTTGSVKIVKVGRRVAEAARAAKSLSASSEDEVVASVPSPRRSLRGREKECGASSSSVSKPDIDMISGDDFSRNVHEAVTSMRSVAKAPGLKGTSQKALKQAAAVIEENMEALFQRSASEEACRLKRDNERLKTQMSSLREELDEIKTELAALKHSSHQEDEVRPQANRDSELMAAFRNEVAKILARVSFLEGKILRPPLVSDNQPQVAAQNHPAQVPKQCATYAAKARKNCSTSRKVQSAAASTMEEPQPSVAPLVKKASAPRKLQKLTLPPGPSQTKPNMGKWETVGASKKVKKALAKARKKAEKEKAKEKARLKTPNSTAVVLTLQPDAVKRGMTYSEVMTKAKQGISLQELGIAGLRPKITVTGARMLQIPGATSGDKADALAEKLRATLQSEDVRISRPSKCAEVRITELDDSATREEVIAAVSQKGGCSPGEVRTGEIRKDRTGLGTVVVSCPVAAVKKLLEAQGQDRRLKVGWSSAQVKLMQARQMRCFRCQLSGHVGVACSSKVDCSQRCFRCGQPGHKMQECSASPHCPLCEAHGKPDEHIVGTRSCGANKGLPKKRPLVPITNKEGAMDTDAH